MMVTSYGALTNKHLVTRHTLQKTFGHMKLSSLKKLFLLLYVWCTVTYVWRMVTSYVGVKATPNSCNFPCSILAIHVV